MAVLLLTTVLYVTACGKETESSTNVPVGSPSVEFPSDETEGSAGEDSQSAEEEEKEAIVSYIFSDMPIAAYEVTGLGVEDPGATVKEIPVEEALKRCNEVVSEGDAD